MQQYQPNQSVGNKSLSFPSFGNTQQQQQTATNLSNFQHSASREKLNQFTLMQQQHHIQFNQPQIPPQNNAYHRNSLNSLMPFSLQQQQQQQFPNRRNSCGVNSSMSSLIDSSSEQQCKSSLSPNMLGMTSLTPTTTTSDINSRLESLCRQMTEQAIN